MNFCACSQKFKSTKRHSYGNDSNYYLAVAALNSKNEKEAKRLFYLASQKGSAFIAKKSFYELTKIGNIQQRIEASEKLLQKYDDEESLLFACRQFVDGKEYTRVVDVLSKLDVTKCDSELAYFYILSLAKINSKKFTEQCYNCFLSRPIDSNLYKLYKSVFPSDVKTEVVDFDTVSEITSAVQGAPNASERLSPLQKDLISFRIFTYRKEYEEAYNKFLEIKNLIGSDKTLPFTGQLVSDMGKACLYASQRFTRNAEFFDSISLKEKDSDVIFYSSFYAARLNQKASNSFSKIESQFLRAMDAALSSEKYDNALWYILNTSLGVSLESAIACIQKYCKQWKDASYFDDIFETLTPRLLLERRWNDFGVIYKAVDGFASDEIVAQYAYIYARLLQEGLASSTYKTKTIEDAFARALQSGTNVYYKALALSKLNVSYDESVKIMKQTKINSQFKMDKDVERFLVGFTIFGLPEKIFPEWNDFVYNKKQSISLNCATTLADFLNKTSTKEKSFYTQALRIVARSANFSDTELSEDAAKLLFPCNYKTDVEDACKKFDIPYEVMFALIRSESFFEADVVSRAGAIGLTQLMTSTADDIAQRLRKKNYSLVEPATNIEFGTYYLANLIKRSDDSVLSALFSYNAGYSRVKRWKKSSRLDSLSSGFAYDLFLETIPFSETREYGRKVVSAASMYGLFHFGKTVEQVVNEIVK